MVGHGDVKADVGLEKELRVLHLDLQAAEGDCVLHLGVSSENEISKPASTMTLPPRSYLLQQGHTYSNKALPPNKPLPIHQAFKHMSSLWRPFLLKPPQMPSSNY